MKWTPEEGCIEFTELAPVRGRLMDSSQMYGDGSDGSRKRRYYDIQVREEGGEREVFVCFVSIFVVLLYSVLGPPVHLCPLSNQLSEDLQAENGK